MSYGESLLSRIVDDNDVTALARHGIEREHFMTEAERRAYDYILKYAEQNGGNAPSYAMLTEETDIVYVPDVTDSIEYLAKKLKSQAAKVQAKQMIEQKLGEKFEKLDGNEFLDWLITESERIKMRTHVRTTVGTNVKTDTDKFLAEYKKRKAGDSFRIWRSKFPFINDAVGGYVSSNVYVVYGKSGRGKSVFTIEEAVECAMQGANVLIWALEMGWFEYCVRIYVALSARLGIAEVELDGAMMEAGFDSTALRHGKLPTDFEEKFFEFMRNMNDHLSGSITIRAVDDEDFSRRDLRQLEADINETDADVVVIDPFYYLDYERNDDKTTGGAAAATSRKLRRLAGRTHTTVFAITQAEETQEKKEDDGTRVLKLPDREAVKKTKQLLEDAYLLIAVDTDYKQGRGLIGLNKGRDGGEGESREILYMPQYGIVREPELANLPF